MKLIKVGLAGYKRFREPTEMDVDAELIAVVGPNEAGKTSFLEALAYVDTDRDLKPSEPTRGPSAPPTRIWARYLLEDEDKAAIAEISEATAVRQVVVTKSGGELDWRFEPDVSRDLRPRGEMATALERFLEKGSYDEEFSAVAESVQKSLRVTHEYLSDDALAQFSDLAARIRQENPSKAADRIATRLEALHEHEAAEHPWETARRTLESRRPKFLYFEDDARELHSAYSFDEPTNQALDNLLNLAQTSWNALYQASSEAGRIEGMLELANANLRTALEAWGQDDLTVRLRVAENTVNVLVNMAAPGDYIGISERSAGLRQFVALRSYIATQTAGNRPVLLIDEADIHLHYDAQADLMEVLGTQEDAEKIIYTTHSAGCLPPDLGLGIRIVVPVQHAESDGGLKNTDDSQVINWFWTADIEGAGFSPILIGMGASTFAFAATRRAVIGEGPADAILLPTLLREVTGEKQLNFQVAPGLSNVSEEGARELDLVAARVVHLVDSDEGGSDIEELLLRTGVPSSRILKLSDKEELVLEDLLDPDVYLKAINEEIGRWRDNPPTIATADLANNRRPRSVNRWCESQSPKIAPPSRRAVAQRVLEQRHERKLVASAHRQRLKRLHARIEKLLSVPSAS